MNELYVVPNTISEAQADCLGMPVAYYEKVVRFGKRLAGDAPLAQVARKEALEGYEIRNNADGSLDEIVGPGFHLEQMDRNKWWMEIGGGLHVWLTTKRSPIDAYVNDEREIERALAPDAHVDNGGKDED